MALLIFFAVLGVYLIIDNFIILQELSPKEDPELHEEFCKAFLHKMCVALGITLLFVFIKLFI